MVDSATDFIAGAAAPASAGGGVYPGMESMREVVLSLTIPLIFIIFFSAASAVAWRLCKALVWLI